MDEDFQQRARWLARNVLPHEALIRARLGHFCTRDLTIEDVIQETYARLLSVPSLESIQHPRQYAVLTAKAVIIDHMRHSRVVSITSCSNLDQLSIALPEASPEERLVFQDEIQEVVGALAQLPPLCREILILRRIEGLSQKETAKRLNITEKSVEGHMARGARALAEMLGHRRKSGACSSNERNDVRLTKKDVKPEY
jgi:RNA polymerase sigma factor (sigma-70 family)